MDANIEKLTQKPKPEVIFLPAKNERGFGWMELFLGAFLGAAFTLITLVLLCIAQNVKHN